MDVRRNNGAKQLYMKLKDAKVILGEQAAQRIFNVGGKYSRTAIATFSGRRHLFLRDIHKSNTVWAIPVPTSKLALPQAMAGDGIELLKLLLKEGNTFDTLTVGLAEELLRLHSEASSTDQVKVTKQPI